MMPDTKTGSRMGAFMGLSKAVHWAAKRASRSGRSSASTKGLLVRGARSWSSSRARMSACSGFAVSTPLTPLVQPGSPAHPAHTRRHRTVPPRKPLRRGSNVGPRYPQAPAPDPLALQGALCIAWRAPSAPLGRGPRSGRQIASGQRKRNGGRSGWRPRISARRAGLCHPRVETGQYGCKKTGDQPRPQLLSLCSRAHMSLRYSSSPATPASILAAVTPMLRRFAMPSPAYICLPDALHMPTR